MSSPPPPSASPQAPSTITASPVQPSNRLISTRTLLLVVFTITSAALLARFLQAPKTSVVSTLNTVRNVSTEAMSLKIVPRPSHERGQANHGWLKTFHTFSFADYADYHHNQFGCLRVINEDRVEPKTGFGTHAHREFEIFSYVVAGELEHRDSMGNTEILKRGDLQMTSTGTGIRHSEYQHGSKQTHFLQIWAMPHTRGLPPKYFTRHFTDAEKTDKWVRIVAPVDADGVSSEREAPGPAPVHSALNLFASIFNVGTKLTHTLPTESKGARKAYIHVIQRSGYNTGEANGASIKVSGGADADVTLREGDGAYIVGEPGVELTVENVGDVTAEVLLFDVDL